MQFEISRLTRKIFAQTNYDATTTCYDRIIPNLAVLASRAYGVPKEVTATNARTLEGASYHVRTALGVSAESYTAPVKGAGTRRRYGVLSWASCTIVTKRVQAQLCTVFLIRPIMSALEWLVLLMTPTGKRTRFISYKRRSKHTFGDPGCYKTERTAVGQFTGNLGRSSGVIQMLYPRGAMGFHKPRSTRTANGQSSFLRHCSRQSNTGNRVPTPILVPVFST